jgi:hypothetical protein
MMEGPCYWTTQELWRWGTKWADSRCPLFHVFTPDPALCFYYKPVTMNWQVNLSRDYPRNTAMLSPVATGDL